MLRVLLFAAGLLLACPPLHAEYGDVVMNKFSEKSGVRPVIFPHWAHRIRYQCKVCHADLEIKMRAGGSDTNMEKIAAGKSCGACHNGKIAWDADRCDVCHSGRPGLTTKAIGGHETGGPGRY